jgi:hypothetical protein
MCEQYYGLFRALIISTQAWPKAVSDTASDKRSDGVFLGSAEREVKRQFTDKEFQVSNVRRHQLYGDYP